MRKTIAALILTGVMTFISAAAALAADNWECVVTPDEGGNIAEAYGGNISLSFGGGNSARSTSAERVYDLSKNEQINISFKASYTGSSSLVNRRIYLRNSSTKSTELINFNGTSVKTLGQTEIMKNTAENTLYSVSIGIKPENAYMVIYINGEKVYDDFMVSKWKSFDFSELKVYVRNHTSSKEEDVVSEFKISDFEISDSVSSFVTTPSDGDTFVSTSDLDAFEIKFDGAVSGVDADFYKDGETAEFEVKSEGSRAYIIPKLGFEENSQYRIDIKSADDLFANKVIFGKSVTFSTAQGGYSLPDVTVNAENTDIFDTQTTTVFVHSESDYGIEKTELYKNGELAEVFDGADGEYIFGGDAGKYEFYAVSYDINGGKSSSVKTVITVRHNDVPKISVSGVTSGEAASPSELKNVIISSSDNDGEVVYLCVMIDGETVKEENSESFTVDLSGISLGLHQMKVIARDNNSGESEKLIKLVISGESNVRQIVFNDFEGYSSDGSAFPSGLNYPAITGDAKIISSDEYGKEHGTVAVFKTDGKAVDGKTASGSWARLNTTGTTYSYSIEMDLYQLTEYGKTFFIFKHPSQSAAGTYIEIYEDRIKVAGTDTTKFFDFPHGQWHHIRFDVDMVKHYYSFWLNGDLIADKFSISPALTQIDTRLVLDMLNTSEYMGYALDNLSIKYIEPTAQFTEVGYDGRFGDDLISPVAETLCFKLNAKLTAATLNDKTVLLYENGEKMKLGKISYNFDEGIITVKLFQKLKSASKYRIELTDGVSDSSGLPLTNGASASFETGYAPLDVKSAAVTVLNGKSYGRCIFTNTTGESAECFIILNIFSGDTPVDTVVKKVIIPVGDSTQADITGPEIKSGEKAEMYIWKSLSGQTVVTPQVFK